MPFSEIHASVMRCRRCPRLVAWREQVAREKRAAYAEEEYWGKPVPGFGDPSARLVVVGLAPGAHGSNRTGRMFTGDRSGDWLYRALHRAGFASQPESVGRDDGLVLSDCYITAPVRCVPPDNKPANEERDACRPFLEEEFALLTRARVFVALGKFGYDQIWRILQDRGLPMPRPRVPFGHSVEVGITPGLTLMGSFHPSQQNTFTGRLTEETFDGIWSRARALLQP